jgi:protein-L-isoaspartate(D-aspartate) O-methyltransferase
VIAIDAERQINNGQPATLATFIEALELKSGDRVVHIGCGVGYYTAIIAETVGPQGHVLGVELDAELANRARTNLSYLPQAEVVQADGGSYDPQLADALLVNAGATHPRASWLDSLLPGGRLLIPLTIGQDENTHGVGLILKITREQNGYTARFISSVMIFPCIGSRDEESNQRLREAMMKGTWSSVQSLRRERHEQEENCWLHGDGYCLSTLPV